MDQVKALLLSRNDIAGLLDYDIVWPAVEQVFAADARKEVFVPYKEPLRIETYGMQLAMPGYIRPLNTAGVKWVNYYGNRNGAAYPTSFANLLVLNRADTGIPYAILEATDITNARTAGGHALIAAKYLARQDVSRLSVLGCGAQARAGILAFDRHFRLSSVTVFARTRESMEKLKWELQPHVRAEIQFAASARDLAERADMLLTASRADDQGIREEWVPEGCTLLAVSSFTDIDPALSKKADKWFLGSWKSDQQQIIDSPQFKGQLHIADVYGTIGEVIIGARKGRENNSERILFSHMGMGPLDIAVGKALYDLAVEKKLGTEWVLA